VSKLFPLAVSVRQTLSGYLICTAMCGNVRGCVAQRLQGRADGWLSLVEWRKLKSSNSAGWFARQYCVGLPFGFPLQSWYALFQLLRWFPCRGFGGDFV